MELVYAGTELGMGTSVNPLLNICHPDFQGSSVDKRGRENGDNQKTWKSVMVYGLRSRILILFYIFAVKHRTLFSNSYQWEMNSKKIWAWSCPDFR